MLHNITYVLHILHLFQSACAHSYLDGDLHDHAFRRGCGHDCGCRFPPRSGDLRVCALREGAHPPSLARGQNHYQSPHPLNKQRKALEGPCISIL